MLSQYTRTKARGIRRAPRTRPASLSPATSARQDEAALTARICYAVELARKQGVRISSVELRAHLTNA